MRKKNLATCWAVAQRVQQILDDGDRLLTEAAIFPDVIRNDQPETKPFHFIDIPFRDGGPANPANVFESKDEEQLALDIAAIHTR